MTFGSKLTNITSLGHNKKTDSKTYTINRNEISQRQNITNANPNCIYGKELLEFEPKKKTRIAKSTSESGNS